MSGDRKKQQRNCHSASPYLGLSGPSRDAVGLNTGALGLSFGLIRNDVWPWSLSLGHTSEGLPSSRRPSILLVRSEVEQEEENEVRTEDTNSSEGSKFFPRTRTPVGHPRKISGAEISVGCEVDKSEVDNELDDLQPCNPLFPPDVNTASALEVVPVHDNMDCQVQSDGNP